jgi:hypothetical protein
VTAALPFSVNVQVLVLLPPLEHAPDLMASRPLVTLSVILDSWLERYTSGVNDAPDDQTPRLPNQRHQIDEPGTTKTPPRSNLALCVVPGRADSALRNSPKCDTTPLMVLLDQGGGARDGDVRLMVPPPDLRGLVEHVSEQTHPEGTRAWRVVPDASPDRMRMLVHILCALACAAPAVSAQSEKPSNHVAEVANVRFVSDPLVNLHHVLYAAAWARRPDRTRNLAGELPASLDARMTTEERAAWDRAVDYYDRTIASRDLLRTRGMYELKVALAAGNLASDAVGAELRAVLESALPVYRRYFWPDHDRANRAWIAASTDRLNQIGPEVIAKLEKLYGVEWFTSPVRVDVVWVANREGAYTTVGPPPHAVVSVETADWAAVEIVLHEFSHVLVLPLERRLAAALGDRIRDHRPLWHAIQFYLTGAAVQGVLKARGISYTPFSNDLFNRAWPRYRKPVEASWEPYVHGKIGLDDAIAGTLKMLDEVK